MRARATRIAPQLRTQSRLRAPLWAPPYRALRWIAIGGVCLCATACDLANLRRPPEQPTIAAAPADDGLKIYLETMSGLGSTDPARQADVFYEVERDYTR